MPMNADLSDTQNSASTIKTSTFSKAEKIDNIYGKTVNMARAIKRESVRIATQISNRKKKKANTLKSFFKASLIKFLLLKRKSTFTSGIKGERNCSVAVRVLLNMRYKHIEDCCTTSCSSHPSLKLSSCSSQNDNNKSK